MQALPRPKIALLNLGIHQFSYSELLIHLKKHLKRSLFIEFKENPLNHFSLRESLPKPEIGIPNLDIWTSINVSAVSDYFIQNDIQKGIIKCCLKEIIRVDFLK